MRRRLGRALILLAVAVTVAACGTSAGSDAAPSRSLPDVSATSPEPPVRSLDGPPVVLAAGDIADCTSIGDDATAQLVAETPGLVLTLGDNAYQDGSAEQFARCYDPTWGRFKDRTVPAPGNHDYRTPGAAGYFGYFGAAAGDPSRGYYSVNYNGWHLVVLNSECSDVGGCGADSPQARWLAQDLARSGTRCTLAVTHHPRFSSGKEHGDTPRLEALWDVLYADGVDVVLSGHEHVYERFDPMTPTGDLDEERGIRSFVVGTGGKHHYGFADTRPHTVVRNDDTFGVLRLDLAGGGYSWRFEPVRGGTFTDSGSGTCHD